MPGLPKSYIKKYGISKKAWTEYRKANKGRTTKRKTAKVKHVAKRRRRYTRKTTRRKKDRRIPLAPTLGFALPLAFGKPYGGTWASPMEAAMDGSWKGALQSALVNLTGIAVPIAGTGFTGKPEVEINKLLNPLDFSSAGAIKGLVLGALVSKFVGTKFGVNRTMKKIPFLGKYIKL